MGDVRRAVEASYIFAKRREGLLNTRTADPTPALTCGTVLKAAGGDAERALEAVRRETGRHWAIVAAYLEAILEEERAILVSVVP